MIDLDNIIPPYEYVYLMTDQFTPCKGSIIELIRSIALLEMKKVEFCGLSMNNGLLFSQKIFERFLEISSSFISRYFSKFF